MTAAALRRQKLRRRRRTAAEIAPACRCCRASVAVRARRRRRAGEDAGGQFGHIPHHREARQEEQAAATGQDLVRVSAAIESAASCDADPQPPPFGTHRDRRPVVREGARHQMSHTAARPLDNRDLVGRLS